MNRTQDPRGGTAYVECRPVEELEPGAACAARPGTRPRGVAGRRECGVWPATGWLGHLHHAMSPGSGGSRGDRGAWARPSRTATPVPPSRADRSCQVVRLSVDGPCPGAGPASSLSSVPVTAAGYALAVNIARRHLSKGQQAMVVARAVSVSDTSTKSMAESLNGSISRTRIQEAKAVLDHAPDLADGRCLRRAATRQCASPRFTICPEAHAHSSMHVGHPRPQPGASRASGGVTASSLTFRHV